MSVQRERAERAEAAANESAEVAANRCALTAALRADHPSAAGGEEVVSFDEQAPSEAAQVAMRPAELARRLFP